VLDALCGTEKKDYVRERDIDVQMEDALMSGTPLRCAIPDDSGKARHMVDFLEDF
jgi:hypothetical protein